MLLLRCRPGRELPQRVFRNDFRLARNATTICRQKLACTTLAIDRRQSAAKYVRTFATQTNEKPPQKEKFYVLSMFPYPSGSLHMGHLRVYTISDVISRYKRMQGYDVLHPMGWDSFGLPAENAAVERGVNPAEWTKKNIETMKEQLTLMGAKFDWDRELSTSDPKYYAHTQRLFLQLYEQGLAYRAPGMVNFDPVDQTVLANEQVSPSGISWRSGAVVEQRYLNQWFFKITDFAEKLLSDLDKLGPGWPEKVKSMQKHWIGKSTGANVKFPIVAKNDINLKGLKEIEVFTTRLDTILGVEYIALSVRHPLVQKLAEEDEKLANFLQNISPQLPAGSKVGYRIQQVEVKNPLPTADVKLPVFVAPYVLDDYGHGAVMGVPGHDERDNEFWKENFPGKSYKVVIDSPEPTAGDSQSAVVNTKRGTLTSVCGKHAGLTSERASHTFMSALQDMGLGSPVTKYRLRDWLVSRQRYWGAPIPIIHCANGCGVVPVPDKDLPVLLPEVQLTGKGGSPLEKAWDGEWVKVNCPKCGHPAKRETDTMDTFVDSSWYFFRFADPHNTSSLFSPAEVSKRLPVDLYIGGIEHAILHLLYSRFISKFFTTTKQWDGEVEHSGEPFRRLITQGMVHGQTYSDPDTGRFLRPDQLILENGNGSKAKIKESGKSPLVSFEKMSKSKYNGVDPVHCISEYGLDATRCHILFQAPVEDVLNWDETKIVGMQRWLGRAETVVARAKTLPLLQQGSTLNIHTPEDLNLWRAAQAAIRDTTSAMEEVYGLNTTVSTLTKLTNALFAVTTDKSGDMTQVVSGEVYRYATETMIKLMAPLSPAMTSKAWNELHEVDTENSVHAQAWPVEQDEEDLQIHFAKAKATIDTAVQVNGKLRFMLKKMEKGQFEGDKEVVEKWLLDCALAQPDGAKWLGGKDVKRVIVVRGGNVVNFVV